MSGIMKVVFSHDGDSSVGMDCRSFECEFDFDCWERGERDEFLEHIAEFLVESFRDNKLTSESLKSLNEKISDLIRSDF